MSGTMGSVDEMTGGQALVAQLIVEGAKDIFAIPGIQLDWAVEAIRQRSNELRLIVPRHEQATSYMADGYARTTGREAVCMVVPGPGMLNALSGIATAYALASLGFGFIRPGYTAGSSLAVGYESQGSVAGKVTSINGASFILGPSIGVGLYELHRPLPYLSAGLACLLLFAYCWKQLRDQPAEAPHDGLAG